MRLVLVKFSVSSTWWNDERFPYAKLQSLLHGVISGRRMRQIVRAGKEETSRNSRKNTKTTTEGEELWETQLRDEKIEWSWEKYKEMGLQNAGAKEKMVVRRRFSEWRSGGVWTNCRCVLVPRARQIEVCAVGTPGTKPQRQRTCSVRRLPLVSYMGGTRSTHGETRNAYNILANKPQETYT